MSTIRTRLSTLAAIVLILTVFLRFEQEEVAPEEQEHREDQDDGGERAPRTLRITACRSREQLDSHAQQHEREDEQTGVADGRGHAGAEARELELEHEVLRRLDPKTPRELRHGRGSRVRHLGGILTAKEDQWLPCNCGRWRWERSSTPPSRCSAATPASSSASRSVVRVCRLD